MVAGILTVVSSKVGRVPVGEVILPAFSAGFGILWFSMSLFIAFTWRAFRPASAWALGYVVVASLVMFVSAAGCVSAVSTAPAESASADLTVNWLIAFRAPLMLNFVWSAVESIHHYRMSRRRMAIGLGDPLVANRFLLWGSVSVYTLLTAFAGTILHLHGMGPMNHPLGAAVLASGGIIPALLMTLVFMPPVAYRRFIEGRAGLSDGGAATQAQS